MNLLSATEIFAHANRRGQAAVPCLDVAGGNVDIVDAVSRSLSESGASAFLSSTPQSIATYLGMDHFVRSVAEAQDRYQVVVAAHLDHAEDPQDVELALDAGVRSVMFDGSSRPLVENISESRRLVERAHALGATLEAEVGVILGKEHPGVAAVRRNASETEVVAFVAAVVPDLFAPAIGTVHGRRGDTAEIAWESAEAFGRIFAGPLVLHGTTGLPVPDVRRLVSLGYRKVNYATAVRDAFVAGVAKALDNHSGSARPQHLLAKARREVRMLVDGILLNLMQP
jgi:tagatose 1,6-diphosphate aldolase GatY/KbaY